MRDDQRLLIIDGNNLVRRVHSANPEPDPVAKAESAARACAGSFRRALKETRPTHAIAVFDPQGTCWRNELMPEYHADRDPMCEQLRQTMPLIQQALQDDLGVPSVTVENYEADDVIAMIARKWLAAEQGAVCVMSTDKDLGQLIAEGATMRDHFSSTWRDSDWVLDRFGVAPSQLGDWLALRGDPSDGISGVPGVGEKRATDLLVEYDTLEGVLAAAPTIKGKMGEKLVEHADHARLCRQLVDFRTDMTIGLRKSEMEVDIHSILAADAEAKAAKKRRPRAAPSPAG